MNLAGACWRAHSQVALGPVGSKALERGLIDNEQNLTDDQILDLIFQPGFFDGGRSHRPVWAASRGGSRPGPPAFRYRRIRPNL